MISGHLNLTQEEFDEHYVPLLKEAFAKGDAFIVGDAPGADTLAQQWLDAHFAEGVIVFHMYTTPRNLASNASRLIGGFISNERKDAAMTYNSDYDIAWIRPGKEKSGTQRNLNRRIDAKWNEIFPNID